MLAGQYDSTYYIAELTKPLWPKKMGTKEEPSADHI